MGRVVTMRVTTIATTWVLTNPEVYGSHTTPHDVPWITGRRAVSSALPRAPAHNAVAASLGCLFWPASSVVCG